MAKTNIIPGYQTHIDLIKDSLRAVDRRECAASCGLSGEDALQQSFEISRTTWVGTIDKVPVVAFGVASSGTPRVGVPWLLATDRIDEVGIAFVRNSKHIVDAMLKQFPFLVNYVSAENALSKKWLKWCGFTIEPPEPLAPSGVLFQKFWIGEL